MSDTRTDPQALTAEELERTLNWLAGYNISKTKAVRAHISALDDRIAAALEVADGMEHEAACGTRIGTSIWCPNGSHIRYCDCARGRLIAELKGGTK